MAWSRWKSRNPLWALGSQAELDLGWHLQTYCHSSHKPYSNVPCSQDEVVIALAVCQALAALSGSFTLEVNVSMNGPASLGNLSKQNLLSLFGSTGDGARALYMRSRNSTSKLGVLSSRGLVLSVFLSSPFFFNALLVCFQNSPSLHTVQPWLTWNSIHM